MKERRPPVTRLGLAFVAISLASLAFAQQGGPYCILRNQDLYGPPNCFQFYLADTTRTSGGMVEIATGGACVATALALRQGWEVDPALGGPYWNWEAGDDAMKVLSRFGDDAYGCRAAGGGGGLPLPPTPPAPPATPGPTSNPFGRYCVLRDPDLYGPPNCFQFYLADTTRTSGQMAIIDAQGFCWVTPLAARQGYEVDPTLGGPYRNWEAADFAMTRLSRYGDDVYGCLAALWPPDDESDENGAGPGGPNACRWAFDGECDEPGIGTGLCAVGTDTADCALVGGPDSCRWAFDGECDEPGIGTGLCAVGTDTADCALVGGPDSCRWAFDGECDEPGIGTGLCAVGTDTADCASVGGPDSCRWAFDGECDEPGIGTGLCAVGTDTADCASVGGPDSCRWAFDGECDEPGIGTGLCAVGTDTADCALVGGPDSCRWAFDGECDEPGIGTGLCAVGTDTADCRGGAQPGPIDMPDDVEQRQQRLDVCADCVAADSGGVEGTVDTWDISAIPAGASFYIAFDAHSVPDSFRVTYQGAAVLDTGWRGDASYGDQPRYAAGIAGPGQGQQDDLFVRAGTTGFTVTVIGGEDGTAWDYRIRCRTR